MRQIAERIGGTSTAAHEAQLDLVVPFTTPELTMAALNAANRLGTGLASVIRLLKVQLVPYPLDISESPVPLGFLQEQLESFPSELPTSCEIRLARDLEEGLKGALNEKSLVLLATRKRPWRTCTERLANSLRRAGYRVLMVSEKEK